MSQDSHNIHIISELTKLSLNELISAAVTSSQSTGAANKIVIQYKPPKQNTYVLGDPEQLLQVLRNLITNAIRFGSKGDKIVIKQEVIQGKRYNDISDFVRVAIRICGLAISKEMFDIVIEKFQNLNDLLLHKPLKTSGLELSYSQQVIKNLGGNIWVKSQLGKGLTFYFTIPLSRQVEEESICKDLEAVDTISDTKNISSVEVKT